MKDRLTRRIDVLEVTMNGKFASLSWLLGVLIAGVVAIALKLFLHA